MEYWLVNNDKYCTKILEIYPGYQCSLHCHAVKDETFTVLKGQVKLEHGNQVEYLTPGDGRRIFPGTFHRFSSLSKALILESSTEHSDLDCYRKEPSRKI